MRQLSAWIAVIFSLTSSALFADIDQINSVNIIADNDDQNPTTEGIFFESSGFTAASIKKDTTDIYNNLNVDGTADLNSTLTVDGAADLNSTLTVDGATDLNSTLTVDGAADLNSTLTVDGATTITGSITQTAGNIDFTTASDGSIKMSTAGANGGAFITLDPSSSQSSNLNGKSQDDQSVLIYTTASSGSAGDIDLISADDIEITAIDNIYLDAADDVEIYAIQDLEILAMRLGGETTNTDTATELTGYGGILAIQGKDTNRYIADANGKIVLLDNTDDWDGQFNSGNPMKDSAETVAAGTTAQLLVGDVQGNMRGLVVQENKTTLSGGQNAASLTLDTRGATFSNPTTGAPIQVHGVADGTADFDAVNVRQLYSGLAAVMAASTPELRLEPGKSSAAFGVGLYGGHSGVGFGVGHMFDNNTVLTFSAGKAAYSEPAYKASFSWTW